MVLPCTGLLPDNRLLHCTTPRMHVLVHAAHILHPALAGQESKAATPVLLVPCPSIIVMPSMPSCVPLHHTKQAWWQLERIAAVDRHKMARTRGAHARVGTGEGGTPHSRCTP